MSGVVVCLAASGFVAELTSAQGGRVIRAVNVSIPAGGKREVTVPIQLESQGNESSASFSLRFNPFVALNPVVALGSGVRPGSILEINTTNLAQGQIGVFVRSTATYPPGTHTIVTFTFTVPATVAVGTYPVGFGSVPTSQNVSSSAGVLLPTTYEQGFVVIGAATSGVEIFRAGCSRRTAEA